MNMIIRTVLVCLAVCLARAAPAVADPAPFDLNGPTLQVLIVRGGKSLPISAVPNLLSGDELTIKADLPADQSAHYLLVAGFLRGATNPPPKNWFYQAKSWTKAGHNGLKIVVPAGAQQAIVLLAPESGGDFDTIVGAVRGRPGAFVRASQDLNQVSLDRSRLDAYLDGIRRRDPSQPDRLAIVSPLLARSLAIKLNVDCLQRVPALQAACLTQNQDSLVLNDGHSTSIAEAFSRGLTADLALQISATPQGGLGYYSPYIAAIRDIVGILGSFHTAQYQYIPALAVVRGDRLALVLNSPPSFHNPKSVLTTALPSIQAAVPPPLQLASTVGLCAQNPSLVLPVEGAPLVYSSGFARDMVLRLRSKAGQDIDLPVKADAEKGGLIVDTAHFDPTSFDTTIAATVHGNWGPDAFDGPRFILQNGAGAQWQIAEDDRQALVVGRDDVIKLEKGNAACIASVALRQPSGETQPLQYKETGANGLAVTVPLATARPGAMVLLLSHFGATEPSEVPLQAYKETSHVDRFVLAAGDLSGVLSGSRLDEVVGLDLGGLDFKPDGLTRSGTSDRLTLSAGPLTAAPGLTAGETKKGTLHFVDGRSTTLKVTIAPPSPRLTLISKTVQLSGKKTTIVIRLSSNDLPRDARLVFSMRAAPGSSFDGEETIEVAATDGSASVMLTGAGGLARADAHVLVATLDPTAAFAASVFGPLRFRLVQRGVAGDWQPLATLVRLPVLATLKCSESRREPCELSGTDLFLIDSLSSSATYASSMAVPEGFTGTTLPVPHPTRGQLYLKLNDDPGTINELLLSGAPESPAK